MHLIAFQIKISSDIPFLSSFWAKHQSLARVKSPKNAVQNILKHQFNISNFNKYSILIYRDLNY